MSVTQDYKTVTYSLDDWYVILRALDARVILSDKFIDATDGATAEYWAKEKTKTISLRIRVRDLVWTEPQGLMDVIADIQEEKSLGRQS